MLEAKFYTNSNPDFLGQPTFSFLNNADDTNYRMLYELTFCNSNYIINDVIVNLEKVMSGELPSYEFGYDATIIDFGNERSVIHFNYFEDQTDIDSAPLYKLMYDWADFLVSLKNKQG